MRDNGNEAASRNIDGAGASETGRVARVFPFQAISWRTFLPSCCFFLDCEKKNRKMKTISRSLKESVVSISLKLDNL